MDGERAFVERLRDRLPHAPQGQVWIGDDAAVLSGGRLVATDALVTGVHFDLTWTSPTDVGWKALAVNLSDLAAMGGTADAAVVSIVVPPEPEGLADAVLDGAAEAAEAFGCPIVGGDTTSGPDLVISVTVIGVSPPEGAVLRSGAAAGDTVFVTGPLGGARRALGRFEAGETPAPALAAALRRPPPRLEEGRTAAAVGATAMIDLSDGFATDLGHLVRASGVGVRVDAGAIPVAEGAELDDAVIGGDDYELCFTAPDAAAIERAFDHRGLRPPVRVGVVTEGTGCVLVGAGGDETTLEASGWEHPVP